MTLQGASPATVERALRTADPFPGTAGFAGALPDGRLVRDVLGRYPLFVDRERDAWSPDPRDLTAPEPFPPGHVHDADGDERVWRLPDPEPYADRSTAVEDLRTAIDRTLTDVDADGLAVAFSGGVDSAVVATHLDAPLYVVGFPGGRDLESARDSARRMNRDIREIELTRDALTDAVPTVARAIGRTNAMDVGIALPLYFVARRAREDGYDRLAVGQGADELFGGYAKVARAPSDPRVEADTVRGATREVVASLPDQLPRDVLAIRAGGVEPVAPLLHDRVVATALALPESLLVDGREERKLALRLAARASLPDPVAFREKTAVQYGSLVARELDRLARQAGFKRRLDDHVSRYIQHRVDADD